ncbi:Alpha/beta hydrolase fold-1 [Cubamyces menziesii]|nr:Alpha/beta hydrolase fold-1 [Cubamyces menziesii]
MRWDTTTVVRKYPSEYSPEGLYFVAKRYVPHDASNRGLTLLFFHCTGSHKEVWEPVIQSIFDRTAKTQNSAIVIREAWTFDWQSHGEAGRLNRDYLARLDAHVLATELVNGVKRFAATEQPFDNHTLIGIGHSSGVTSLLLTTIDDSLPAVPYKALIVMEPSALTREVVRRTGMDMYDRMRALKVAIQKRCDNWATRKEAKAFFIKRMPWKAWDQRALELFLEHGLVELPVQNEDGTITTRVFLCCLPYQEGAAYYGHGDIHHVAAERLQTLDPSVPVHFMFSAREEVIPKYVRDSLLALRHVASLQFIPRSGHLVVQEKPDEVSAAIVRVLEGQAGIRANL